LDLDATKSVADNNQAVNEVVDNDPPGDQSRSGFCFGSRQKREFPSIPAKRRGEF
jgi:hypothetical protein